MARALGNHMRQRRLEVFDLVDHHGFNLADRPVFHIAERRVQEAVGQPQPETL